MNKKKLTRIRLPENVNMEYLLGISNVKHALGLNDDSFEVLMSYSQVKNLFSSTCYGDSNLEQFKKAPLGTAKYLVGLKIVKICECDAGIVAK